METARGVLRRLTSDPAVDENPVWSPDGNHIAFDSRRRGKGDLYVTLTSGAAPEELLLESPLNKNMSDWSRDGRFILYEAQDPKTRRDLWALPLDGDGKPLGKSLVVAQTDAEENHGRFSPDGRWIVYTSGQTEQNEIVVKPFPGIGSATQISTSGGDHSKWRDDGKEIFYTAPDNRLMAVSVSPRASGTVDVGNPVALFTMRPNAQVVASPDGQRFLIETPIDAAVTPPLTVVLNWQAALGVRESR
jgi:Tol biopolymer transport system component